jgi:hypothetical protein
LKPRTGHEESIDVAGDRSVATVSTRGRKAELAVKSPLPESRFFMKKLFGLLMAVVMVSAFAIGCGEKKKTTTTTEKDGTTTKSETTTK